MRAYNEFATDKAELNVPVFFLSSSLHDAFITATVIATTTTTTTTTVSTNIGTIILVVPFNDEP